jgi:hypothetical protein
MRTDQFTPATSLSQLADAWAPYVRFSLRTSRIQYTIMDGLDSKHQKKKTITYASVTSINSHKTALIQNRSCNIPNAKKQLKLDHEHHYA